ncbi:hypothetical protein LTR48_008371, partial [Friedmanniomyces endolithicus]
FLQRTQHQDQRRYETRTHPPPTEVRHAGDSLRRTSKKGFGKGGQGPRDRLLPNQDLHRRNRSPRVRRPLPHFPPFPRPPGRTPQYGLPPCRRRRRPLVESGKSCADSRNLPGVEAVEGG